MEKESLKFEKEDLNGRVLCVKCEYCNEDFMCILAKELHNEDMRVMFHWNCEKFKEKVK